jgi:hypothetical protein
MMKRADKEEQWEGSQDEDSRREGAPAVAAEVTQQLQGVCEHVRVALLRLQTGRPGTATAWRAS